MKRVIAVFISVVLAFSVSVTTFAKEKNNGYIPVIYVTGFAQTPLAVNIGTDKQHNVFMPEKDAVVNSLLQLIVPTLMLVFTGNESNFASSLCKTVNNLMKDVMCDDNGNPINESVDIAYRDEPSENHDMYSQHCFLYDWREDVFDIASELNDYIEKTKELTGYDKVALKGESLGGAVVMTYLSVYGSDSVDTVIMQSSAFNGITMMGGIFTGDLEIKSQSAINYIGNFIEGNDTQTVFYRSLYYNLAKAVMNPVAGLLDKAIVDMKEKLYDECIKDMLGNIPGIWTFIPQEKYEEAKAFMLDENENAELIKKIDRYHYGVMDRTKEILDEAISKGMKLAIISNYEKAGVFVNHYDTYQSDFLIDTKRTSLGATCSDFGTTLGDGYVQAIDDGYNHISCDNEIDASTCAYPEYTWFVKDMMHTWYSKGYVEFTYYLIYSGTQQTVFSNPNYPQFLVNNHETHQLEPLTPDNMNTNSIDVNYKDILGILVENINK